MYQLFLFQSTWCFKYQHEIIDFQISDFQIDDSSNQFIIGQVFYGVIDRVMLNPQVLFVKITPQQKGFLSMTQLCAQEFKQFQAGKRLIVQVKRLAIGDKLAQLTTQLKLSNKQKKQLSSEYIAKLKPLQIVSFIDNDNDNTHTHNVCTQLIQHVQNLQSLQSLQSSQEITKVTKVTIYHDLHNEIMAQRMGYFLEKESIKIQHQSLEATKISEINCEIHRKTDKNTVSVIDNESNFGAFIIIEKTAAFTAIDVNAKNSTKSFLDINLAMILLIIQQLKWRKIYGIVVIDFINMHHINTQQEQQFFEYFEKLAQIYQLKLFLTKKISPLGLVELSIPSFQK